ncbi:hypothetical protein [Branchiibius sp. NY16-3462-2]|uniref:hypothetical protein n=1 Tax=Branchiibius sp. NY16-3462-2 TaxID=1807500 RepID=UPI0007975BD8|nr:hypothetical protein [Branchiibius sp. NY16-3462-2]KYH43385.1 hypothetical protein AZH51_16630 [Branchiibius sp. NY16-3462-2]
MTSYPALGHTPSAKTPAPVAGRRRGARTARAVCATAAVALIGTAALPAAEAEAAGVRPPALHYVAGTSPTAIPVVGDAAITLAADSDGRLRRI